MIAHSDTDCKTQIDPKDESGCTIAEYTSWIDYASAHPETVKPGQVDRWIERRAALAGAPPVPRPRQDVLLENIPTDIKNLKQWIVWQLEPNASGKHEKVPYCPWGNHRKARTNDAKTWGTFDQAVAYHQDNEWVTGLGIVFANGLVGVDIDYCLLNGKLTPTAAEIVKTLATYTERSQSGRGVHCLAWGKLARGGKCPAGEMYDRGRFFATTGDRIGDCQEVNHRQAELETVYKQLFGAATVKRKNGAAGAGRPPKTPTAAEIAKAEEALSFLSHWRCVDYQGSHERGPAWLDVGMALFNSLGMAGLPLWDNWSKLCPEEYAPGVCAAKYDTFRYNPDGWHLGSLIWWGRVDSPPIETPEPPPPEDDTSEIRAPIPFEIFGPHRICGKRAKGKVYPKVGHALFKAQWRFCGRNDCPVCARHKHEQWTKDILAEALKNDLTIDVIGAETYTAATKKLTRDGIAWCSIIGTHERSTWVLLLTKRDSGGASEDELLATLGKWLDGHPSEDVKPKARLLRSSRSIVKDGKTQGNAFFALKATTEQEDSNWAIETPDASIAQLEQTLPIVSPEMQAWVDEAKDIPLSAAEFNALVKRLGVKATWAKKGCTVKLTYEQAETLVRQLNALTCGQKRGHSRWGVAA